MGMGYGPTEVDVLQGAWKKNGIPALLDASIAKLFFTETSRMAAWNAFQIHGAYGYYLDNSVRFGHRDKITF